MAENPWPEFRREALLHLETLVNLVRAIMLGGWSPAAESNTGRMKLPNSALPLRIEDMDARLRTIRRYITPKELAGLMKWHRQSVYNKVKQGMPADRDGRRLKIYPPAVADWLRKRREAAR